jgi:hypothetical protein
MVAYTNLDEGGNNEEGGIGRRRKGDQVLEGTGVVLREVIMGQLHLFGPESCLRPK